MINKSISVSRALSVRSVIAAAVGLTVWAGNTGWAQAVSKICAPPGGYVVAFYNESFATPEDADAGRAALRIARHGKWVSGATELQNGEPVRYETFYSTPGKAAAATESRFEALATHYRSSVLDGALVNHWEYFWDMVAGDATRWATLAAASKDDRFTAVTTSFPATVKTRTTEAHAALTTSLASDTTVAGRQFARAQALYTERQKLLFVGQGQGSLFSAKSLEKLGSIVVSSVLRMDVLARPATALQADLGTKFAALVTPANLLNNQGFFTATLSWSVPAAALGRENDLDLHIIEPAPGAKHVHYVDSANSGKGGAADSLQGDAGYLDKDSTGITETGPEHYYATCDEAKLVEGVYEITVTQEGTQAPAASYGTLQIATAKEGEIFSKTFQVLELPGFIQRDKLVPVVKVRVQKVADGNWKATIAP